MHWDGTGTPDEPAEDMGVLSGGEIGGGWRFGKWWNKVRKPVPHRPSSTPRRPCQVHLHQEIPASSLCEPESHSRGIPTKSVSGNEAVGHSRAFFRIADPRLR